MFPRRRTFLLAALAAQVAIVQDVRADRGKAVVTGVVRDAQTGDPIPGALVVATSTALQGEQTVTTDSRGLYRLPNLPPGVYNIQFFAQNYDEARRTSVTLNSDQRIRVDAGMEISSGAGSVRVVEVPAPTVDIGSSTVGQTLDSEFVKRVPIAQPAGRGAANRSFEAVAEATPGAANDTYGTSIAGTTSPENNYTVNGMNVGDAGYGVNGTPLSSEFVKEVKVDAGGYMPEFGRSTGGVLNAVTKSGSDKFHGGIWMNYTPGRLEGQRKLAPRVGTTVITQPRLNWIGDIGADIGGPILKDRLWFYAGFSAARTVYNVRRSFGRQLIDLASESGFQTDAEGNPIVERIPGTDDTRKAQSTQLQAIAKLDFRASKNHQLSITGIVAPTLSGGDGTYSIDPASGSPEVLNNAIGHYEALGHTQDSLSGDVIANWNASTNNKSWLFDTMVGYHYQRQTRLPVDGSSVGSSSGLAGLSGVTWRRTDPHSITDFEELSPAAQAACAPVDRPDPMDPTVTQTLVTCPVQTYLTGGPGFIQDQRFGRFRGRHMVTFFGQGAGHHEVKFGIDGEYLLYNNDRGYSGQRSLRESTSGNNFLDIRQYALFEGPDRPAVLNSINWTSQSVIMGAFAQDSWAIMDKVTLNAGLRYDAQLVYGGDGELVIALPNQISPRVGLIWDPTYKGKSKLYFSYGRFFQSVPLDIADRSGSGEPLGAAVWSSEQGVGPSGCNPLIPDEQRGDCRNSSNLIPVGGPTSTDQTNLVFSSGKTPVDPNLKAQSQDEILLGAEYEVFEGARLALTYQRRWLNRAIEDMSRDEATTYFIGNPGEGAAKDFPKAERNYDAIIVQLQKSFRRDWMIAASYTASWLRGNIAGLFRPETGQLDPFINSDFDLISLLPNRVGFLPGDRRHVIKVFSAGEIALPGNNYLTMGGAFRASSGGPTDYLGSHPLYGSDEVFILPRGSGERLPWVFRIDTSFGYRYNFSEDLTIGLNIAIFNVMNFQTAVARDTRFTNDDVLPISDGSEADLAGLVNADGEPVTPNPNFGQNVAFQSPRQFSFGLRFTF